MASAEYYLGTAAAQQMGNQRPPNSHPPQQPQQQQPLPRYHPQQHLSRKPNDTYDQTQPPSYSSYPAPSLPLQHPQPRRNSQQYPQPLPQAQPQPGYQQPISAYPAQLKSYSSHASSSSLASHHATPPYSSHSSSTSLASHHVTPPYSHPSSGSLASYRPMPPNSSHPSSSSLASHQATPPGNRQAYQPQPHGYNGTPLRQIRSHSQPPRVRFADEYDSDSSPLSTSSDSDSPPRGHRHRGHRHHSRHRRTSSDSVEYERPSRSHHSHPPHRRSSSASLDRHHDRDFDTDRSLRSHHHHHEGSAQKKEHKNRDTFLGASAGGLIGDAIFPGLGAVGGLLLGGYGGRKHARSRSDTDRGSREEDWEKDGHWHHPRSRRGDGWDEESATFKKGLAVR